MSENTLSKAAINPIIIENQQIDGSLNSLFSPEHAKDTISPNVKFYDEKVGQYISGVDNAIVINEKSIRRISIDLPDGNTRYFRQIAAHDGKNNSSGMKATAWQETDKSGKLIRIDDKQEIRISFTGFTTDNDLLSSLSVVNGKLNPQAIEAVRFTNDVIKKIGTDNISGIVYSSHSLGTGNALAAKLYTDLENIPTKMMLFVEPVAASLQRNKIRAQLVDENSPLFKALQDILGQERTQDIKDSSSALSTINIEKGGNIFSIFAIRKAREGNTSSILASLPMGAGLGSLVSHILNNDDDARKDVSYFTKNAPLGTIILQDISNCDHVRSESVSRLSPRERFDYQHRLSTIVNCIQPDSYYVSDNTNVIVPQTPVMRKVSQTIDK